MFVSGRKRDLCLFEVCESLMVVRCEHRLHASHSGNTARARARGMRTPSQPFPTAPINYGGVRSGGVVRSSGIGLLNYSSLRLEANLRHRATFAQTLPLALAGALRPSVRVLRVVRVLLDVNFLSFQSWG